MSRIQINGRFQVANFIIKKNSYFLVEKRSETAKVTPGDIASLGGHCEDEDKNKTDDFRVIALKRELDEELKIKPLSFYVLCSLPYKYKEKKYDIHYFVIEDWEGKIDKFTTEDGELIWLDFDKAEDKLSQNVDKVAINLLLNEY